MLLERWEKENIEEERGGVLMEKTGGGVWREALLMSKNSYNRGFFSLRKRQGKDV